MSGSGEQPGAIELVRIKQAMMPIEHEPAEARMALIGGSDCLWSRPDGRVAACQLDAQHRLVFLEPDEDAVRYAEIGRPARLKSISPSTGSALLVADDGTLIEVVLPSGQVRVLGQVGEPYDVEAVDGTHVLVRPDDGVVRLLERRGAELVEIAATARPYGAIYLSPTRAGLVYAMPHDDREADECLTVLRVAGGLIDELATLPNTLGGSASLAASAGAEIDGRVFLSKYKSPFHEVSGLPAATPSTQRGGAATEPSLGFAVRALVAKIRTGEKRTDLGLLDLVPADAPPDLRAILAAKSQYDHHNIEIGRLVLRNRDPRTEPRDSDDEPRTDVLVIGESHRGDHFVVYKNAKGPVTPVFILKTEDSWEEVRYESSIDHFIRDCVSDAKEDERVDIEL